LKEFRRYLKEYLRGADMLLLFLCVGASAFGCVLISSAARTANGGAMPLVRTQIISIVIGVFAYLLITAVSLDWLSKLWKWILAFNVVFILLIVPFGVTVGGNKSWLNFSWLPFRIGPPEVVKASFILLLAAQMYRFRENVSGFIPVAGYAAHTFFMVGMILVICDDMGVALIYIAILIAMMIGAGVKPVWFLALGGGIAAMTPLIWALLSDVRRERLLISLNPMMDPYGRGWHILLSMRTLRGGGLTGQGLYKGVQVGSGDFPGISTDFIFSACGEELGLLGCGAVLLLLCAIIIRVLFISRRAKSGLGALICFGVAGMMIFQTFENVFMCAGVTPVIGITLPFFSYGGSSNIVMFAAMGMVSSVKRHPKVTWLDY
jgi:rod shape determining protein RodA